MKYGNEFIGEALGTFILVLFGCGSVAVAILFDAYQSILQIAFAWGVGVSLAIYLTRHISCAHLNPAVSISMVVSRRMPIKLLPTYLLAQFFGALIAGFVIYLLFSSSIVHYEAAHSIVRGAESSMATAKMFGEFYSSPGKVDTVSLYLAMTAEGFGTFLLLLLIFALTEGCNVGRPDDALAPVFIGLAVTSIICLIAPLTQAGLNPARDFSPRMVAWLLGWGDAAFPDSKGGFFWVYIFSPIIGGILAAFFFTKILEPAMKKASGSCNCRID